MKVTNKIKALSTMTLAAATLFLAGCQAQSNTLTFTPQSPTASMNINQSAVVTVNTRDSRPQQEIATYTKSGELIKLNASPSVTQLFQQVMQQNLVSKGFRIGQANNANAGVTVDVKENEQGLINAAKFLNLDLEIVSRDKIKKIQNQFEGSDFVEKTIGVRAVSEPVALLSSAGNGKFLVMKEIYNGITISIYEEEIEIYE